MFTVEAGRNKWLFCRKLFTPRRRENTVLNGRDPASAWRCSDPEDSTWTLPRAAAPLEWAAAPTAWGFAGQSSASNSPPGLVGVFVFAVRL